MADYNYKIFNKDFDDYFISKDSLVERGMFNSFFSIVGLSMFGSRSGSIFNQELFNVKQASINLGEDLDNNISVVTTDGKLFCWGTNDTGNIGDNSIITRSSPVQIGSENNWRWVSNGVGCTAAIKNDGTLWTWGLNTWGQLGVNDVINRSSPVQVGSDDTWRQIYFTGTYASGSIGPGSIWGIKNNGTLWAWGYNDYGGLGLNDNITRSSPTQVGSDTNWKQVSLQIAIKNDGTLWNWTETSSPIQVGSDTNWKQVSSGQEYCIAIKTDGTAWGWGKEDNDQLGISPGAGDAYRSSPVQILTGRYWTSVQAGKRTTILIGRN